MSQVFDLSCEQVGQVSVSWSGSDDGKVGVVQSAGNCSPIKHWHLTKRTFVSVGLTVVKKLR